MVRCLLRLLGSLFLAKLTVLAVGLRVGENVSWIIEALLFYTPKRNFRHNSVIKNILYSSLRFQLFMYCIKEIILI